MKVFKVLVVCLALVTAAVAVFLFAKTFINHSGSKPAVTTDVPGTLPPATDGITTEAPVATAPPAKTEPVTTVPPVTEPPETDPGFVITVYETPIVLYSTAEVNIRMQPNTTSDRYGMLSRGEKVTVTGETNNGWYQIVFRDIYTGYVFGDYLTAEEIDSGVTVTTYEAPVTRYATEQVNVRESYSTNSSKRGYLTKGETVSVIGETSNGWYQIMYGDKEAYVYGIYLSTEPPVEDTQSTEEFPVSAET